MLLMSESTTFQMRLLPAESVILEARPSPRVAWVWLFTKALPAALLFAGAAIFVWLILDSPPERGAPRPYSGTAGVAFVGSCFLGCLLVMQGYNVFLARTYLYRVTSHRFIFAGGILRKTTHAVEHRRATDVQFSQNLIEQVLSLSCVNLSTPGTVNGGANGKNRSMPELRLEGLLDGEAVFQAVSDCIRNSHGPAV